MLLRVKTVFIKCLFIFAIAVVTIMSLSACALFPQKSEALVPPLTKPKGEQYQTVEVKRGTITNDIKGQGTIVSAKNYPLYFKTDGRLESINVNMGGQIKKGQILARLDIGNIDEQIELARLDLDKAELDVERAKEALTNAKKTGDPAAVKNAEYSLEQAQLNLNSVEINLDRLEEQKRQAEIISPIDGVIMFKETVKKGDNIPAYKVIIQIADPNDLQVSFDPANLADPMIIKPGMKVNLTLGGKVIAGEVISCPYSAPSSGEDAAAIVPVIIKVPEMPKEAIVGDSITINIILAQKEGALIVPKEAVRTYMNRNYVEILDGNTKKEVDVETGIITSTEIEILSGLKEGQQVIIK
jgi:RND family efflux transporter MFP subunit